MKKDLVNNCPLVTLTQGWRIFTSLVDELKLPKFDFFDILAKIPCAPARPPASPTLTDRPGIGSVLSTPGHTACGPLPVLLDPLHLQKRITAGLYTAPLPSVHTVQISCDTVPLALYKPYHGFPFPYKTIPAFTWLDFIQSSSGDYRLEIKADPDHKPFLARGPV